MKIVLAGSLGHIGRPLTQNLVQKGHDVTVISSKAERQKDIEALGAIAAIGSLQDAHFLTATFSGADAVYTMVPPPNYFDPTFDLEIYCNTIVDNFAQAITKTGIKRLVHLSSVGAHLEHGSGLISLHRNAELRLNKLSGVAIAHVRPVGFYYNLYSFISMIKSAGVIAANYGADDNLVWVSPIDIAAAVAEELETPATGNKVRYVASDELTGYQTATILGEAIGKPDLKWLLTTNEQMQSRLEDAGMKPQIAAGLTEMFASQHEGRLTEDFYRTRPAVMGNIKLAEFAKEFAVAYNQ